MKTVKRFLALLLVLTMILSNLPVAVLADELNTPDPEGTVQEESQDTSSEEAEIMPISEEPEGDTNVELQGDTNVEPQGDTNVEPQGDTNVEPQGDTNVEPAGDTNVEPAGDANVEPEGDTNVEPAGDASVEPEGDTNTDPDETPDQDLTGDTTEGGASTVAEDGTDGTGTDGETAVIDYSAAYLTCELLDRNEEGWYVREGNPTSEFGIIPGQHLHQIYYVNYTDENGELVREPVHAQAEGMYFEPIADEGVASGQEYGEFFYRVSADESRWDQDIAITWTAEDGTVVYGVVAYAERYALCAYTSTDLSNETVIPEVFMADISANADNVLYVGMREASWEPDWILESIWVEDWCSDVIWLEDIGNDRVQRIRISDEGMRRLRRGESFDVTILADINTGEGYWEGRASFTISPDMSTTDPYLTVGYLDDYGYGKEEPHPENRYYDGIGLPLGQKHYVIFYLNYWDENEEGMVQKPVHVEGSQYVTVGEVDDLIEENQENAEYFCMLTSSEWDRDTEVTYTLDDGREISLYVWTGRPDIGLYTSANLSNDTWRGWEPIATDIFGENSVYIGLNRDGFRLKDVTLPEEMTPYFGLQRINDQVFKLTMNRAGLGRNLNEYHFGTQFFVEIQNYDEPDWVDYQNHWATFSREHIEGTAFFWVNDEAWELFVDGDKTVWGHTWKSGETDEWGNNIWGGEVTANLPVGLSYDHKENLLTMNNFQGQYLGMCYKFYMEHEDRYYQDLPSGDLTIQLMGQNSLISDVDSALRFEGGMNVTFVGDGSLYVKATNSVSNVDEEGNPYHYPAAYVNNSTVTFADSVDVTFEIAGEGLEAIWDDQGNCVGSRPAFLAAMHSDYTTIVLKDDAKLTSVVPEDAKMGSYDDSAYRYGGFNNMSWKIRGGTLNTSTLGINNDFHDGKLITNGYEQTGGIVNIKALSYLGMNDEYYDEEGNRSSVLHTHYAGLTADPNCWITISGGELNIDIDHDFEGGTPSMYYHGIEARDTLVSISGGTVRVSSNIEGCALYLQTDWDDQINQWGSKLDMTGGTLEFYGPDHCYGQAINLEPGSEANLMGGTIEVSNRAFHMGGEVLLDGTTINIYHGDFRADGEFTMNSGELNIDYRGQLFFNCPSTVNGGKIHLENSQLVHTGAAPLGLSGGEILINNTYDNAAEGIAFEAMVIHGYCTVENDCRITINNGFQPVPEFIWPYAIGIAGNGILHQMGGSITINQSNPSDNPEERVQAIYLGHDWDEEANTYFNGQLLMNDGTFTINGEGNLVGIRGEEGTTVFVGAMEDGQMPVMTLNNVGMEIGGILDLEWNANVTVDQGRVEIWRTGTLQMGDDPDNTEMNPVFTVNYSDDPERQAADGNYWVTAVQTHPESSVILNDGTLNVNAEYCDNAIMIDGTFVQNGGEINSDSRDPEWNATEGENAFCTGRSGSVEIHGGVMNLSGTDTGFSITSHVGSADKSGAYITGGTFNINVDRLGMYLEDRVTITGGDFNIHVAGHVIDRYDENGNFLGKHLYEQGIMFYGDRYNDELGQYVDEPAVRLDITGGDFEINLASSPEGYFSSNVRTLFVVMGCADITGGTMILHGGPVMQISENPDDYLNIVQSVYSLNTGEPLKPVEYDAYYDANYEYVEDPAQAIGAEYITQFEEDNIPGDYVNDTGMEAAEDLVIISNKAGSNLTWHHEDGILTFGQEGGMDDFSASSPAPWTILSNFIHTVEMDGKVHYVGAYAFNGLKKLTTIDFMGDVPEINPNAFAGVKADGFYPVENTTWDKTMLKDYGGTITWAKGYLPAEVMEVTWDDEDQVLRAGEKATLTAVVTESLDPAMKVVWSLGAGDKNFVTLTSSGKTATITAKKNAELREITVYVTTNTSRTESKTVQFVIIPKATKVNILDDLGNILNGTTQYLYMSSSDEADTMQLYVENESRDADDGWTWKSSNSNYATVDENGLVTALQPGKTVTITATATDGSGKRATVNIKTYQPVENLALPGTAEVGINKTISLTAVVSPADATNKTVKWEILPEFEGYATISSTGKLKGLKEGTIKVRVYAAEDPEMAEICEVTIRPPVTKVNILKGEQIVTGTTVYLYMDPDPTGESIMVLSAVNDPEGSSQTWTWKSSNTNYATVDAEGRVTALQPGKTVTITATAADGSGKIGTVKVKTIYPVEKLELPEKAVAAKGKSITLVANILPANATEKALTWSLVNPDDAAYVTLSTSGKLTVKSTVTEDRIVTVRAAWTVDPAVYTDCDVTVYATPVTKVTIQYPEEAVYLSGALNVPMDNPTIDLSALTETEDAADEVTWKSSNTNYATVDENGLVTILTANKAVTITATAADGSAKKATINVKGVYPVTDIALNTAEELFIAGGKSLKLATLVNILPENASNKKLEWFVEENTYGITVNKTTGVLTTKAVTEPIKIQVTVKAVDGFGGELTFDVWVYPATTKIVLKEEEEIVSGKSTALQKVVGNVFRLTAINDADPDLAAGKYTWKSSASAYVDVDENGNVTVLQPGKTVTITCTAADGSGKTATVKILGVYPVTDIALNTAEELFVAGGKSLKLATLVNILPENASNKKLEWFVEENTYGIAVNKTTGVLTTKAVTERVSVAVTAKAADGFGAELTFEVRVYPATTKIVLKEEEEIVSGKSTALQKVVGDVFRVTAVNDADPDLAAGKYTWKSSASAYVDVDENGYVTVLQPGKTVTITCTAADGSGKTATVKILGVYPVTDIALKSEEEVFVAGGKSLKLATLVDILPANASNKKLEWFVEENTYGIAVNKTTGVLTTKAVTEQTTVEVTAKAADGYGEELTFDVWVYPATTKIVLMDADEIVSGKSTALQKVVGDVFRVTAVNDADPDLAAGKYTWKSSASAYVDVDENGYVTVLQPGKTVTITCTAADGSGKTATVKILGVYPVTDIALKSEEEVFVAGGKSLKLATMVDILPANASNKKLEWFVEENTYGITVNKTTGVLTTKAVTEQTTVEVTARAADGFEAELTFDVWVYPATTKIVLMDADEIVSGKITAFKKVVGDVFQVEAVNDTGDNPDLAAGKYTWKSSASAYVDVDENGYVTVLQPGKTVTITCTAADGSGKTATVKILGVYPVTDIALKSEEEVFVAGGKSLKLATMVDVLPSNASSKTLTWSVEENTYGITVNKSTGVLTTKTLETPVTVEVTALAADGFEAELTFDVWVYPATTKIVLMDEDVIVSGQTAAVKKSLNAQFQLEAVNDTGDNPDLAAGKYTWKSSNSAYVSVDEEGYVTVLQSGKTVTITCTAADGSGKTATVKILGV